MAGKVKHWLRHEWEWEIIQRDPFTVRQKCKDCGKTGQSVSTRMAIQRSSRCYFCPETVTTWRTYADGTVACLECVKKYTRRMA